MVDSMASSEDHTHGDDNIPKPPPLPRITYKRFHASSAKPSSSSRLVPKETVDTWEKLFKEGIGADAFVVTDNYSHFPAHSCVLVSSCQDINLISDAICSKIYGKFHSAYDKVSVLCRLQPHPLWLHFWISRGVKMENHISKSLGCLVK